MLIVGEGGFHLFRQYGHILRCAAVGHGQIIAAAPGQLPPEQLQKFFLHLLPAPDLGHAGQLSLRREAHDGLDVEHGAGQGGNFADPSAFDQIFQGIHRKIGDGVGNERGYPPFHQRSEAHTGLNILPQLQEGCADAQTAAERVKDRDLQITALLGGQTDHVVCAGKARREMDGNDLLVSGGGDGVQRLVDALAVGERGLGQLAGLLAGVDIGGKDVHTVAEFAVPAADLHRNHKNRGAGPQIGAQVGAGVGEKGDFFRVVCETICGR